MLGVSAPSVVGVATLQPRLSGPLAHKGGQLSGTPLPTRAHSFSLTSSEPSISLDIFVASHPRHFLPHPHSRALSPVHSLLLLLPLPPRPHWPLLPAFATAAASAKVIASNAFPPLLAHSTHSKDGDQSQQESGETVLEMTVFRASMRI